MKYQIIFESPITMPDDEFRAMVEKTYEKVGWKVIEARSLEGIRSDVWQKPPDADDLI